MDLWSEILNGAENSSWLELIAVIFGLASVWLASRENIALYPTGIVNVGLYIYICATSKLYADMGINIYYLLFSIYGWYHWSPSTGSGYVPITSLSRKDLMAGIGLFGATFLTIWWLLVTFTDSDVPLFDSTTTSLSIVAMWWMARKRLEHWILWILADILSVPLYIYKGLAFTAFQFFVFTIIAVFGYFSWKKSLSK